MSTQRDWITREITPPLQKEAEEFASREDQLCGGRPWSVYLGGERGRQNPIGAYGMIAVMHYLTSQKIPFEVGGWGDPFDLRLSGSMTVDVKTKRVRYKPHSNHMGEVIKKQLDHKVDAYLFCYWLDPIIYLMGWLYQDEFKGKSEYYEKGQVRYGSSGFAWTCQADCRLLEIRDLSPVSTLRSERLGKQGSLSFS